MSRLRRWQLPLGLGLQAARRIMVAGDGINEVLVTAQQVPPRAGVRCPARPAGQGTAQAPEIEPMQPLQAMAHP
eukprot:12022211-Prorocentrum_lima.AAC.1